MNLGESNKSIFIDCMCYRHNIVTRLLVFLTQAFSFIIVNIIKLIRLTFTDLRNKVPVLYLAALKHQFLRVYVRALQLFGNLNLEHSKSYIGHICQWMVFSQQCSVTFEKFANRVMIFLNTLLVCSECQSSGYLLFNCHVQGLVIFSVLGQENCNEKVKSLNISE